MKLYYLKMLNYWKFALRQVICTARAEDERPTDPFAGLTMNEFFRLIHLFTNRLLRRISARSMRVVSEKMMAQRYDAF